MKTLLNTIDKRALWGGPALTCASVLTGLLLICFSEAGLALWMKVMPFMVAPIFTFALAASFLALSWALLFGVQSSITLEKGYIAFCSIGTGCIVCVLMGFTWKALERADAYNMGPVSVSRADRVQMMMGRVMEAYPQTADHPLNVEILAKARSASHVDIKLAYDMFVPGTHGKQFQRLIECLHILGWSDHSVSKKIALQGWASPQDVDALREYALREYACQHAGDRSVASKWSLIQQAAYLAVIGESSLDHPLQLIKE